VHLLACYINKAPWRVERFQAWSYYDSEAGRSLPLRPKMVDKWKVSDIYSSEHTNDYALLNIFYAVYICYSVHDINILAYMHGLLKKKGNVCNNIIKCALNIIINVDDKIMFWARWFRALFPTCAQQVTQSNRGLAPTLHGFIELLRATVPWNGPRPLHFTAFPIHHSLIILPFGAL